MHYIFPEIIVTKCICRFFSHIPGLFVVFQCILLSESVTMNKMYYTIMQKKNTSKMKYIYI